MNWLTNNVEWLFSGLGLALCVTLFSWLRSGFRNHRLACPVTISDVYLSDQSDNFAVFDLRVSNRSEREVSVDFITLRLDDFFIERPSLYLFSKVFNEGRYSIDVSDFADVGTVRRVRVKNKIPAYSIIEISLKLGANKIEQSDRYYWDFSIKLETSEGTTPMKSLSVMFIRGAELGVFGNPPFETANAARTHNPRGALN